MDVYINKWLSFSEILVSHLVNVTLSDPFRRNDLRYIELPYKV